MYKSRSMEEVRKILLSEGYLARLNLVFGVTDLDFYRNKALQECKGNGGVVAVSGEQEAALREILAEAIPEWALSRLRLQVHDVNDIVVRWDSSGKATAWSTVPGIHKRSLSLHMLEFSREGDYFYEGTLVEIDLFRYSVCAAF